MSKFLFLFSIPAFLFAHVAFAKKTQKPNHDLLIQALVVYQKAPLVRAKTVKRVESDFLEKTTIFEGVLYLGQGRFRWETSQPDQSIVIFDGQYLYSIQDGQATRSKITKQVRQQSLMVILFSPQKLNERFDVKNLETVVVGKKEAPTVGFQLTPKTKDIEIEDLEIFIDKKSKKIERISYKDEVGQLVQIAFSDTEMRKSKDNERFSYQPAQGEKIIDL